LEIAKKLAEKSQNKQLSGGKMGKVEKLGRKSLTAAVAMAVLSCAAQTSYASVDSDESAPQIPNPLEMNRSMLRLNDAWTALKNERSMRSIFEESNNSLSAVKRVSSGKLETVKFQHFYKGLEVIGSMVMHQTSLLGSRVLNRIAQLDLDTHPRLDEKEASEVALSLLGKRDLSNKPSLKILPEAEGNGARLVYWVDIDANDIDGAREVIIDANSGEVIGNISKNIAIAPISVFSAKNQGTLITQNLVKDPTTGKPAVGGCTLTDMASGKKTQIDATKCKTLQMTDLPPNQCQVVLGDQPAVIQPQFCQPQVKNSVPVGNDPSAIRAFQNSQAVLSYYQMHHGRNSYDNKGSSPVNVVHGGIGYDNAYWSTQQNVMVYGDGDGKVFNDFTLALDVAGHEQTHGVVAYSAKFLGMKESGALNEAFADFFGKMIANDNDWAIGRKIFVNPAAAKGVRDIANPGALTFCASYGPTGTCAQRRPFPTTLKEKMPQMATCDGSNDNCWVHINSTIVSHAAYLVVQSIGAPRAEKLYYAAMTHALTARDDIASSAKTIKTLCPSVLDAPSCQAVTKAYASVGL
jgi:Zn-dependent metalloprotease